MTLSLSLSLSLRACLTLACTPNACTTVIVDECNPGLIDPAEKVSPLMRNRYLRAERAKGAVYRIPAQLALISD